MIVRYSQSRELERGMWFGAYRCGRAGGCGPRKTVKNPEKKQKIRTPPSKKKSLSESGGRAQAGLNRLFVGPAFGWSVYLRDDENDMGEVILYLGLISINIKYW